MHPSCTIVNAADLADISARADAHDPWGRGDEVEHPEALGPAHRPCVGLLVGLLPNGDGVVCWGPTRDFREACALFDGQTAADRAQIEAEHRADCRACDEDWRLVEALYGRR